MERDRLVRRAPQRPLVWLGEREPVSDVRLALGERFGAWKVKERDFVLGASHAVGREK